MPPRTVIQPVPQPQVDKLLSRVAQPMPRHYNGQGVAQPSDYVPLTHDAFMPAFEALWAAHVEFGTTRSHKRLFGKRRAEDRPSAATVAGRDAGPRRKKAAPAEGERTAAAADKAEPPHSNAQAVTAKAHSGGGGGTAVNSTAGPAKGGGGAGAKVLANKGRFGGTLAARLLSGDST